MQIYSFPQQTPLHIAAEQGRDYTVKCLVKRSADVNIKDKEGVRKCDITTNSRQVLHVDQCISS